MAITALIQKLKEAEEPSRKFDTAIALALGFESFEEEGTRRVLWRHPLSNEPVKIPWYTRSFDEAKELTDLVAPDRAVAVTWKSDGSFGAQVDGGPPCQSSTGPMALCIAALSFHENNPHQ